MKFTEMNLKPHFVEALLKQQITEPTKVQAETIPVMMEGKDIIVRSKTGSGKTIAFLLPIMQNLHPAGLQALILAPTRELALQTEKEIRKLDKGVKSITIYGGVSINPQIEKLRKGVQIVVGTPGRILDHMERGTIDFSKLRWVVLDEADRMLDMGFIEDVHRILSATPKNRQTALFSATMPAEIIMLTQDCMKPDAKKIILEQDEITVKKIRQVCYGLDQKEKLNTLVKILRRSEVRKAMIFCNTKSWADSLGRILRKKGFKVGSLHSALSQLRRNVIMQDFQDGKFNILVCTDVAARGLHVDDVTHVINYDLPKNPKDYIHRIGRTGRAGEEGDAISFCTMRDEPLLKNIEREIQMTLDLETLTGGKFQRVERPQITASASVDNGDWGNLLD
ncbi:MAG: DEAD/DEAH box helicase [Candidatus Woesearchaeota archaeon]